MSAFDLHFSAGDARALALRLDPAALRNLVLGAASAGFQCEGGYNGPGQPQNNWSRWEGRNGVIPSGDACRFWERFPEDAALMAAHGLRAFRLSLEWTRLQQKPPSSGDDGLDAAAIAHYARILATFARAGVEPVVTLYHWTHPVFLGVDFWLRDDAPALFAAYLEAMLPRLLDGLLAQGVAPPRRYVTLNEPNMFALATYLAGRFPHEKKGSDAARRSIENQLLAHLAAVDVLRAVYRARSLPAPAISLNNNFSALYRLDALFIDLLLAPAGGVPRASIEEHVCAREETLTRTMLESEGGLTGPRALLRWGFRALEGLARGGLRAARFPRLVEASYAHQGSALDYLAFDYYDPFPWNIIGPSTPGNDRGFGPVVDEWNWKPHPRGLSAALGFYARGAPGLPVWLAENGIALRALGARAEPRRDGARRDLFIQAHLYELLCALAEGVPVQGYLHWSLWDNYEWGSYQPRFGLIGLDARGGDTARGLLDAQGVPALDALAAIARATSTADRDALAAALSARRDSPPG